MMKKLLVGLTIAVSLITGGIVGTTVGHEDPQVIVTEVAMTVDDVVSIAGTDYFIVKDYNTWAVLEEDVYMDREVVEIAICDDTENTLCLFIELDKDETPHIKKW